MLVLEDEQTEIKSVLKNVLLKSIFPPVTPYMNCCSNVFIIKSLLVIGGKCDLSKIDTLNDIKQFNEATTKNIQEKLLGNVIFTEINSV